MCLLNSQSIQKSLRRTHHFGRLKDQQSVVGYAYSINKQDKVSKKRSIQERFLLTFIISLYQH